MKNIHYPLRRLKDITDLLVSPDVGILKFISEFPTEPGAPKFFRYFTETANAKAFGKHENFVVGSAAATTRDMAIAKTIGEAIERYCPSIYDKHEFELCSYKEAKFPCVPPKEFALYTPEQFNDEHFMFRPFTDDSKIRWTSMLSLTSNERVFAPACMVYLPYTFLKNGDETPISQPISTGLSAHCSYYEAAVGGICEVIERDSFSITWQAKLTRPKIKLNTLSPVNKDLTQRFEAAGYQVHLVDITSDNAIPTILAVLRSNGERIPALVVAASTSPNPEEAVKKALEELAHTERYAQQINLELDPIPDSKNFSAVRSQVAHVRYWCDANRAIKADFLIQSPVEKDFNTLKSYEEETPEKTTAQLVNRIAKTGYQVLIKELTTEDIGELGMNVVRVIIPGYHPLQMGYKYRALGGKRLYNIPKKLGFKGVGNEDGDYKYPHPFP